MYSCIRRTALLFSSLFVIRSPPAERITRFGLQSLERDCAIRQVPKNFRFHHIAITARWKRKILHRYIVGNGTRTRDRSLSIQVLPFIPHRKAQQNPLAGIYIYAKLYSFAERWFASSFEVHSPWFIVTKKRLSHSFPIRITIRLTESSTIQCFTHRFSYIESKKNSWSPFYSHCAFCLSLSQRQTGNCILRVKCVYFQLLITVELSCWIGIEMDLGLFIEKLAIVR